MRVFARRWLCTAVLASLAALLSNPAGAQGPPAVVKYPGGPDVQNVGGNFAVPVNGVIRWSVVIDNSGGLPLAGSYLDHLGLTPEPPAPVPPILACDNSTTCLGTQFLELLCTGPDAPLPFPPGSTCDPATGILNLQGLNIPAGVLCLEFSTRVRPGALAAGVVANIGCLDVGPPINQRVVTRPTTSTTPSCVAGLPAAGAPGCSNVLVANIGPPDFSVTKPVPAGFDDRDGNTVLSLGDRIAWSVQFTNNDTADQDGFIFDVIQAGQRFVSLDADPGGCAFNAGNATIECPLITFGPSETRLLEYTTEITCGLASDDDSLDACDRAQICGDNDPSTNDCLLSDDDGAVPIVETCMPFEFSNMLASTKSASFTDTDGDGALGSGDRMMFSITVRNDGRGTASRVGLTDVLDPGCMAVGTVDPGTGTFNPGGPDITWSLGDIRPGGSVTVSFTVDAIDNGGSCCNQGSITSGERTACAMSPVLTDNPQLPGGPRDPTCLRFGPQAVLEVEKDFALTLDQGAPGLDNGDTLTWTITVTNAGGSAATTVDLDDALLPCQVGFDETSVVITGGGTNASQPPNPPLSAGRVVVTGLGGADGMTPAETVTVRYDTTYNGGPGGCCNQATVTYAESFDPVLSDDPVTAAVSDPTCTNRTSGSVTLTVVKTTRDEDGDGCLEPGENVATTITVSATGGTAVNVRLTDVITDPGNIVSISDAGGGTVDPVLEQITWSLGDIADGADSSVTWTGKTTCDAPDGASFDDRATATADNPATASGTLTTTISAPVLDVVKTSSYTDANTNGSLDPGETVRFTITVANTGSCASGIVTVLDQLDPDLDWTAVVASDGAIDDGSGGLTWDDTTTPSLASLAPAASVMLTVDVAALDPASNPTGNGTVDNLASASAPLDVVTCPDIADTGSAPPLTIGSAASVTLRKSAADADGDGCFEPGEDVTFTLTVSVATGSITGVSLEDVITDPGAILAFVSASDGGSHDPGTSTITWALPDMNAGESLSRTWVGTLACDAPDGASVDDDATVTSNEASDTTALTTTVAAAVLGVDKTSAFTDANANGVLDPGEGVTFTIAVSNTGSCAADGVGIADTIDVDLDTAIVASDGGNVAGRDVTWTPLTTPALASLGPGATVTVTVDAPALDPATNTDPASDGAVDNAASAATTPAFGCPPLSAADALVSDPDPARNEVYVIGGGGGGVELLRNDAVGCRETARATIEAETILQPGGINPAHARTSTQPVGATGPVTLPGDATPRPADACPEASPTVDGRVIIFYQLVGTTADIMVTKVAGDVVLDW